MNGDHNRRDIERIARLDSPRIISSIAVVFDQKESARINQSSRIKLEVDVKQSGNADFFIKNEENSEILARVSDGTIFAYQMSRFCWEKADGKISIADIEVDKPGIDKRCPPGTKANPKNLDDNEDGNAS